MKFKDFLTIISIIKNKSLGGLDTQLKMTPMERRQLDLSKIVAKNPKAAAVLMLIYPNKDLETCFLLTKRANYKGAHSAQISFPGGKKDTSDTSLSETALRETFEEVDVNSAEIKIIRDLTKTYIPPSNFWVYPFIGIMHKTPNFNKNHEVASIIEITLQQLLDSKNVSSINIETSYMNNVEVPCFKFGDHIVWGATAMILNEAKELFSELIN